MGELGSVQAGPSLPRVRVALQGEVVTKHNGWDLARRDEICLVQQGQRSSDKISGLENHTLVGGSGVWGLRERQGLAKRMELAKQE